MQRVKNTLCTSFLFWVLYLLMVYCKIYYRKRVVRMIFGKYGTMILENMEKNYPYRKKELELKGELDIKILQREKYILELKKQVEEKIKKEHQVPDTHEISILAKYQQMIDGLVDEVLMKEILQKI